jgi:type I restriction enzyme S subunit
MRYKLGQLLREICNKTTVNNQYPVLTSSKSGIYLQDEYFTKNVASKNNIGYKIIKKGQFTYRSMSDTGDFFINCMECTEIGIVSPAYPVFEIVDERKVNREFLKLFFKSASFNKKISMLSKGSTRLSLKYKDLKEIEIELPAFDVQADIANKINTMSKNRLAIEKKMSNLSEIVKSEFKRIFDNDDSHVELLSKYVFFQEGPGVRSVDFTKSGTILLTGGNINNNKISFGFKSDRFISNELAQGKYAHFMCDVNDILVVASAIAPDKFDEKVVLVEEDKKYCLNTGIIRFKPNLKYITRGYFMEFLKSDFFKDQVSNNMKGIAQLHFGPSHLKTMKVIVPNSIDKQIEFEAFVTKVDKLKNNLLHQLSDYDELLEIKMEEYFE